MKRLLFSALAALSLAACTTPTIYQPAMRPGAVGYSEYRLEPGRYRVMFHSGTGASPQEAMDLALMRAADLTLANGFDWFQVSDRYVRGMGGGYGPQIGVGVGGMSWGHHSSTSVGVGTGFDLSPGPELEATVEVVMGRGPKPAGLDAYDARALRQSLGGSPPPPPPPV